MVFQTLARRHDRDSFDCGVESVNRYLKQSARQDAERNLAVTIVLVPDGEGTEIFGFHTLVASQVYCDAVPAKRLPAGKLAPAVLLAQLGVSLSHQGEGHGKRLLYHALRQSLVAADSAGSLAVVLDPIDDRLRDFYARYGFRGLLDESGRMYLETSQIRGMFDHLSP